jgi:hypothetical protein
MKSRMSAILATIECLIWLMWNDGRLRKAANGRKCYPGEQEIHTFFVRRTTDSKKKAREGVCQEEMGGKSMHRVTVTQQLSLKCHSGLHIALPGCACASGFSSAAAGHNKEEEKKLKGSTKVLGTFW